ncbi:MAG TPA: PEPxxWA-CTERM sorting domain-containing protein [Polymorphobacter sp.]|nr:PEPxxWA-CTERM sorting domain-containing protein [Polymorphobacter sp.]
MTFFRTAAALLCLAAAPAIAAPVQWTVAAGGNDHWYEFVAQTADWVSADAAARASSYAGFTGHLATLTSAGEEAFNYNLINTIYPTGYHSAWLGGYQTPPSHETQFDADWQWLTGEAWVYTDWYNGTGEPNNLGGRENFLELYAYDGGGWNDCDIVCGHDGYLIEYGDAPTLPPVIPPIVGNVPEPASWALMIAGFGMVGGTLRRRRAVPAA